MTDSIPDRETQAQLNRLGYNGDARTRHERPLLICDVDEVVLHLVDPFVEVLEERGFILKSHSFKLTGNVFTPDGRAATQEEIWDGLSQLFNEQASRQEIVDGAIAGLLELSGDIDILFLTNMPHEFGDIRRSHLASHGLDQPLITNTKSKAPAMELICRHRAGPVGFIDDTPKNLEQALAASIDVELFHFMANDAFRGLAGDVANVHVSTGHWPEAAAAIRNVLVENTERT